MALRSDKAKMTRIHNKSAYSSMGKDLKKIYKTSKKVSKKFGAVMSTTAPKKTHSSSKVTNPVPGEITLDIDDKGVITIKNEYGTPITDESMIRKIKKMQSYKDGVEKLKLDMIEANMKRVNELNEGTDRLIDIATYSQDVHNIDYYTALKESTKPEQYICKTYSGKKPDEQKIKGEIALSAKDIVKSWQFWKLDKMREEYIEKETAAKYKEALDLYENSKEEHYKKEKSVQENMNQIYQKEYEEKMQYYNALISGDIDLYESEFADFIDEIDIVADIDLDYKFDADNKTAIVDLTIPTEDELPQTKYVMLDSGLIKEKNRTQKEKTEGYNSFIFGLSIYLAAEIMSIAVVYDNVIVSAKIKNRENLDSEFQYLYSFKYARSGFVDVDFSNINAIEFCRKFENRCDMLKSGKLKPIVPFLA